MNRREALMLGGAAAVAAAARIGAPAMAQTAPSGPFKQPPLPFKEDALAPAIGAETVGLHYGKHHKAYFDALNKLAAGTPYESMTLAEVVVKSAEAKDAAVFNQAGQAWNHNLYWEQFVPGGPKAPQGRLADAIGEAFGDQAGLVKATTEAAGKVFGSGWVWLVADAGKLTLVGTSNADSPFAHGGQPLFGIDVWEHAYYLDYQNRRADHVKAVMESLVNWSVVSDRLGA
ncbi:superoxide dismutase [Inquilinus sp. Marseille-Q2685]|uniref:superoxide dismutase n=1 Tax=Inquilinus sp. Marseille-Q2685 TaxID=2866581 RepID=UPI001CE4A553|nr:superoxide dismutase [Inquilinus sp. Marseille-Q2685]